MVPKKRGFTVIRNEKNELIPTRTMTGWRVCIDYRKPRIKMSKISADISPIFRVSGATETIFDI